MIDKDKLNRAFDVMALALGEAGLDAPSIVKFLQSARLNFGIPHEDSTKTRIKADLAVVAGELKEQADDSSVDGSSEAAQPSKTRRARADDSPS